MHEFIDSLLPLLGTCLVFGIPLSAIWTHHQRKVLEMKIRANTQGDQSLKSEVEALRQEVRSLRDTTMQYDLSFDTALQRLENRVAGMERRTGAYNESVLEIHNGR